MYLECVEDKVEDGKQMRLGRDFRIRIPRRELWASSAQIGFLDTRVFGEGLAVAGECNLADLEHVGTVADFKG